MKHYVVNIYSSCPPNVSGHPRIIRLDCAAGSFDAYYVMDATDLDAFERKYKGKVVNFEVHTIKDFCYQSVHTDLTHVWPRLKYYLDYRA